MDKKIYYQSVSIIFLVVAIGHLARIFYGWEAVIGGTMIPMWMSWVAVVIAVYLAVRGQQFAKKY